MLLGLKVQSGGNMEDKELKTIHYVDNKLFYQALVEYKKLSDECKSRGEERPVPSNYIGECFMKIATHLSYRGNFINYSFRDEMISDGIENCLYALEKFNPERSDNPFSYYTQVIYFAFIRRIQKEKKQQMTKYKLLENMDIDQFLSHADGNEDIVNSILELARRKVDAMDTDTKEKKVKKKAKKDLTELEE